MGTAELNSVPIRTVTLASLQGSGLLYFSEFVPESSQNIALGVWIVVVVMMVCECVHACACLCLYLRTCAHECAFVEVRGQPELRQSLMPWNLLDWN